MRTLIVSDIHGNLPALEQVLRIEKEVDRVICLGDVINYGPWSNECVDLLDSMDKKTILIAGNHETDYFLKRIKPKHPLVQQFTAKNLEEFDRFASIKMYVEKYEEESFTYIHTLNNQYIYPDSKIKLEMNAIIGHSHYQFKIRNGGYMLYNSGSVGQNREQINLVNYIVKEDEKIELKSVQYDLDLLINEMKTKNYSQECIAYYLNKPRA